MADFFVSFFPSHSLILSLSLAYFVFALLPTFLCLCICVVSFDEGLVSLISLSLSLSLCLCLRCDKLGRFLFLTNSGAFSFFRVEGKEILLSDDSNAFDTIVRRADDLYSLGTYFSYCFSSYSSAFYCFSRRSRFYDWQSRKNSPSKVKLKSGCVCNPYRTLPECLESLYNTGFRKTLSIQRSHECCVCFSYEFTNSSLFRNPNRK